MTDVGNLEQLAQWVWDGRDDPGNPCENYARRGRWVATEFDGGGIGEVIDFGTDDKAMVFIHLVRSPSERQRLQAWDMTSSYYSWSPDDDEPFEPFTIEPESKNI